MFWFSTIKQYLFGLPNHGNSTTRLKGPEEHFELIDNDNDNVNDVFQDQTYNLSSSTNIEEIVTSEHKNKNDDSVCEKSRSIQDSDNGNSRGHSSPSIPYYYVWGNKLQGRSCKRGKKSQIRLNDVSKVLSEINPHYENKYSYSECKHEKTKIDESTGKDRECFGHDDFEIFNLHGDDRNARIVYYSSVSVHHPASVNKIPWRQMRKEWWRLHTFSNYPRSAHFSSILLARQGFVYVGNGDSDDDTIVCFFCGSAGKNLDDKITVEDFHQQLNSNCPIVQKAKCNNVLLKEYDSAYVSEILSRFNKSKHQEQSPSSPKTGIHYENQEFRTHTIGASPVTIGDNKLNQPIDNTQLYQVAQDNVSSKFLPTGAQNLEVTSMHVVRGDENVAGAASDAATSDFARPAVGVCQSSPNDAPSSPSPPNRNESVNSSPQDSALQADSMSSGTNQGPNDQTSNVSQAPVNNSEMTESTPSSDITHNAPSTETQSSGESNPYDKLGIITARPKRHEYAVEVTRLNSFDGWPSGHHIQPVDLAKAGYFFTGYSDCARCFYCGGGLRNWEMGDDVWVEHARWFPKCAFIRQCVGQPFVDTVQELNREKEIISYDEVLERMKANGFEHTIPKDIKNKSAELERDAAVKAVVDYGFDKGDVIKAAEFIKENGTSLAADIIYDELVRRKIKRVNKRVQHIDSQNISKRGVLKKDKETIESIKNENSQMRQQSQCKICMDREVSVVFLPCGHLISCNDCSFALKNCPVCRDSIKGVVRAYLA